MFKKTIELQDKKIFDPYVHGYPYQASCMNFTCLYMWRNFNKLKYEIINDYLCISCEVLGKPVILPPMTKKDYDIDRLSDTLDILLKRFQEMGYPFKMKLLPKHMIPLFEKAKPHQLHFHADRDNFDYVYLAKDLIHLRGRKFHSKKNHWNYFMKHIPHQYVPLTEDLVDDCLSLVNALKKGNYTPFQATLLDSEEAAIRDALTHMKDLGFHGAAILIHNKVEAFTFGEKLNENTMVIHIEKANAQIRGLYQAINQQFCEHECKDVKYVNREEDMGFEYLRKAKKSYNPVKMIEKYDVTWIKEE